MSEGRYSSVDVCRISGVSRSTLFRWERDEEVPKVQRDHRGERVYSNAHLWAVGVRKLRERYQQQMMFDTDPGALAELHMDMTMLKLRVRDATAITELTHVDQLDEKIARDIFQVALESYSPGETTFKKIFDIVFKKLHSKTDVALTPLGA